MCEWEQVAKTMERAASHFREGGIVGFENVARHATPALASIVKAERYQAKVGGREDVAPVAVRVTSILGGLKRASRRSCIGTQTP